MIVDCKAKKKMAQLLFDNISYSFGYGGKTKCILQDISGYAAANELTCIMGPSGSGKTSLLNALAGRIPALEGTKLTGAIKYTGDYSSFRASYIMQDEILFDYLTVKETLQFSVYINYENISNEVRDMLVDETIRTLNLYNVKDTIIGNQAVRGISGGERKRTSIAKEIIYEPKILFVDEPTSGLDSFQAAMVVQNLKEMAKENRIIITVIHQPSSQM